MWLLYVNQCFQPPYNNLFGENFSSKETPIANRPSIVCDRTTNQKSSATQSEGLSGYFDGRSMKILSTVRLFISERNTRSSSKHPQVFKETHG